VVVGEGSERIAVSTIRLRGLKEVWSVAVKVKPFLDAPTNKGCVIRLISVLRLVHLMCTEKCLHRCARSFTTGKCYDDSKSSQVKSILFV